MAGRNLGAGRLLLLAGSISSSALSAGAQTPTQEPHALLRKYAQLSPKELSEMDKGKSVAKILDASQASEIPPLGVVRVKVPGDVFLEKYRDIAEFKKSKEVLSIGKFHSPPRLEDLAALTLEDGEIDALRKCRPGDSKLKLPAAMIERLRKEVDWKAPDHAGQAVALYRRMLQEYLETYLEKGNEALAVYDDKKESVRLADEFRALLQSSPYLKEYAPELLEYLAAFPRARPEGAENFVYWSQEKFGYKPVVSLTHVTIYRPTGPLENAIMIAAKQIYANHYFQGSLGLAVYIPTNRQKPGPDGYLLYINRSRVDLPGGLFTGLVRFFVKRKILGSLDKYLQLIKGRLEAGYAPRQAFSEDNMRSLAGLDPCSQVPLRRCMGEIMLGIPF